MRRRGRRGEIAWARGGLFDSWSWYLARRGIVSLVIVIVQVLSRCLS